MIVRHCPPTSRDPNLDLFECKVQKGIRGSLDLPRRIFIRQSSETNQPRRLRSVDWTVHALVGDGLRSWRGRPSLPTVTARTQLATVRLAMLALVWAKFSFLFPMKGKELPKRVMEMLRSGEPWLRKFLEGSYLFLRSGEDPADPYFGSGGEDLLSW